MSKALFFSFPHYGHIKVQLGLLKALQERGEEVVCMSESEYSSMFTDIGLPYLPYNVDKTMNLGLQSAFPKFRETDLSPLDYIVNKCLAYEHVIQNSMALAERYQQQLQQIKPDYVLYDGGVYMGGFFAECFCVPAICTNTEMVETDEMIDWDFTYFLRYFIEVPTELMADKELKSAENVVSRLRKKFNKMYGVSYGFENSNDMNILYLSRDIQRYEEMLGDQHLFVGYDIDRESDIALPFSLDSNKQLIYITQGSEHKITIDLVQKIHKAISGKPYEVVMAVGLRNRELIEEIKDCDFSPMHIMESAPQIPILKKASLYVTHGGLTGVREALLLGVPMLFTRDRKYSEQIVRNKAGRILDIYKEDSETLMREIECILQDDAYRKCARELGEKLCNPNFYQDAAGHIVDFVQKRERTTTHS